MIHAVERVHLALVYGVAGVGKTALVLRAGESLIERMTGRLAYHRCVPGDSASSVTGAIVARCAESPAVAAGDPAEQLVALASTSPLIICLDDAHHVTDPGVFELLVRVAARRTAIYMLVASREALPITPLAVDHVVCRLAPLDGDETRALWSALEDLYGPPGVAPERTKDVLARGETPLVLKQIFAGQIDRDDHLRLDELPATARRVLALLCAYREPTPLAALRDAAADEAAVRDALQYLVRRFLVEPSGSDRFTLHDTVREAVHRSAYAPTTADHAACLAYYTSLPRARPDADQIERLWHAVGCGRDELAIAIIAEHASDLRRYPPGSAVVERELAAAIDVLVGRVTLAPELLLFRQRISARQGQVEKAYLIARTFVGQVPAADFDLADMAAALGRFDEAIEHADRAAHDTRLHPFMRAFSFAVLFDAHRALGHLEQSPELLAEARRLVDSLGVLGTLTWAAVHAMWMYDRQRYRDAAEHIATAKAVIARLGIPFSMPLLSSLERVAAVASGIVPDGSPGDLYAETAYFRCAARLLHTQELLFRGDTLRARELAQQTIEAGAAHGFSPIVWWGTWQWARAACCSGEPRQVVQRVEDARRDADQVGHIRAINYLDCELAHTYLALGAVDQVARVVERALPRARDPITVLRLELDRARAQWLGGTRAAPPDDHLFESAEGYDRARARLARCELYLWDGRLAEAKRESASLAEQAQTCGWRWISLRARISAAEVLLREGVFGTAEAELRLLSDEAMACGYQRDALLVGLLASACLRARGDDDGASARLTLISARAGELGLVVEQRAADATLSAIAGPPAVDTGSPGARLARRFHLSEPAASRFSESRASYRVSARQREELDLARFRAGVDLARGTVWLAGRWIDVSTRGALLDVLRALAATPNQLVPVETLVQAAWNVEYHALRHHSRVTTTVSRIRKLLGEGAVQGTRDGYRLAFEEPWFVIEPTA